jgi:glycosyltransferase involved in cell wall biosynthesis
VSILTVYCKHKRGGATKRLYTLWLALAERGHEVHYLATERLPVEHPRIKAHLMWAPCRERENALFWAWLLAAGPLHLLVLALRHRARAAVVFSGFYAALCLPPRLLLGLPVACFVRADPACEGRLLGKGKVRRLTLASLDRLGLPLCSKVMTPTRSLGSKCAARYGLAPERVEVVPNATPRLAALNPGEREALRRGLGAGQGSFVVSTSAVISPLKNIGFLIGAFARAGLDRGRLVIIGDEGPSAGGCRHELEAQVGRLGLAGRVVFTGWRTDAARIVAASDLFILPSRSEGFPNALLEALACGVASLASDIAELREVLAHDELLFSLEDENDLAAKMARAASEGAYLDRLRALSAGRGAAFDFD